MRACARSTLKSRDLLAGPGGAAVTWRKLERALLLAFRELYGEIPQHNKQGHGFTETDEFDYFARTRLRQMLKDLAT